VALFITADIGGSKSLIQLREPDGRVICECVEKGMGLALDSCEELPELVNTLRKLTQNKCVKVAVVNLGGRNKEQITAEFRRALPGAYVKVVRESEGDAAAAFGKSVNASVVLLAGTGSIAVAYSENGTVIGGGWGANIGDDGSGYSIGLAAIRRSLAELDGTEVLSELAKRITGLDTPFDINNAAAYCSMRDDVRERLRPFERREIAAKTKLVCKLADQGDPVSLELLKSAGMSLGELAGKTGKKLKSEHPVSLAVTGGLVHSLKHWQKSFEETTRLLLDVDRFIYKTDGLIDGVYETAKNIWESIK